MAASCSVRDQALLDDGTVGSYAELARLAGVTRARMTQIMNLLLLAPDIQEEILFLPRTVRGRDAVTERDLRAAEAEWATQRLGRTADLRGWPWHSGAQRQRPRGDIDPGRANPRPMFQSSPAGRRTQALAPPGSCSPAAPLSPSSRFTACGGSWTAEGPPLTSKRGCGSSAVRW
jgi:hypothetical protein